ncbi:MAG: beta-eliminating lyase-related protein, partial [Pseudohongiellaceae bacterium]
DAACALAAAQGLGRHLDGARVFNAAVKSGRTASRIAAPFDTVSVCLSKGLGAPVGSVLCGPRDFIHAARRWRKMLGGGMRQAGIIAAAGLYALEHNIGRLAEDHANAALLAAELAALPGIVIDPATVQTNMVFFTPPEGSANALTQFLRERGILVDPGATIRLVTHLDVREADVLEVAAAVREFCRA